MNIVNISGLKIYYGNNPMDCSIVIEFGNFMSIYYCDLEGLPNFTDSGLNHTHYNTPTNTYYGSGDDLSSYTWHIMHNEIKITHETKRDASVGNFKITLLLQLNHNNILYLKEISHLKQAVIDNRVHTLLYPQLNCKIIYQNNYQKSVDDIVNKMNNMTI